MFDFILSMHHEFKLERMHLSQFKLLILNSTSSDDASVVMVPCGW